jgi:hypothetical protein
MSILTQRPGKLPGFWEQKVTAGGWSSSKEWRETKPQHSVIHLRDMHWIPSFIANPWNLM